MTDYGKLFFNLIILLILFLILKKRESYRETKEIRICIVYFIYINHERNWKHIVESQLNDILESKILLCAELNIVVVDEKELIEKSYFDNILNNHKYKIEFHNKNYYEYWGIKKLYELSQDDPDKIYLYMHSKGMVFNFEERNPIEKYLTNDILINHKKALKIFEENKKVTKIGTIPASNGWIWFNFFYVRGEYLKKCNEPIISDNRYYYESYLGTENNDDQTDDSYSLYFDEIIKQDDVKVNSILLSDFTEK